MKLPEPVAWWDGKETAWFEHELDGYKPPPDATIPLFTEAQLREALASHEAVMRQALKCLKNSNAVSFDDLHAIAALEEQLK